MPNIDRLARAISFTYKRWSKKWILNWGWWNENGHPNRKLISLRAKWHDTIKIYEAKKTRSDAISHHHHNHQMTHDIYMSHGMWSHPYAIHLVHFLANKFSNQINLLLSYSNRCCGICDISKKICRSIKKANHRCRCLVPKCKRIN